MASTARAVVAIRAARFQRNFVGPIQRAVPAQPTVYNRVGQPYPEVIDPRTGKKIPFPEGDLRRVPVEQRVEWNRDLRGEYIKDWYDAGYATPEGGWSKYDVHHILPREFGGTNDFGNLVPVERLFHQQFFNPFWAGF